MGNSFIDGLVAGIVWNNIFAFGLGVIGGYAIASGAVTLATTAR